jgi:hypothetical protein
MAMFVKPAEQLVNGLALRLFEAVSAFTNRALQPADERPDPIADVASRLNDPSEIVRLQIHTISVGLGTMQGFEPRQFLTPVFFLPEGYGLGLPGVYLVWLLVVAILYPFCKWVAAVKARRRDWWLSYV